jgi:hypothetical protein
MNRSLLVIALFTAASAALVAQEGNQSTPYSGVSTPPPDETITADPIAPPATPIAKPPAGQPMEPPPAAPVQPMPQATMPAPPMQQRANPWVTGTDDGIVQVAPPSIQAGQPMLTSRGNAFDPDGDIVHPEPLPPGVMGAGMKIRVRLMDDLSSGRTADGQPFRSQVSADVEQDGQILIPAGAEIDGRVTNVSTGHFGGQGSMILRPERVLLPDGSSYHLNAVVTQTPMSRTHVGAEGVIRANDNIKRDVLEYGGAVGVGVVAGASLGGPIGALAGGLVGASVVTVHLLVNHPQARINAGDVLVLTLTENMRLETANRIGE